MTWLTTKKEKKPWQKIWKEGSREDEYEEEWRVREDSDDEKEE